MKTTAQYTRLIITVLLVWAGWGAAAQAETIDVGSGRNDNQIVMPSTLNVTDFFASAAGTITLNVKDMHWGDLLSTLSTSITTFSGQRFQQQGDASFVFDIGANERFTTSIYAVTSGSKGFGLYSLDIAFMPNASAVPLPLGVWTLLAGIGLLASRLRRVRPVGLQTA